MRSFSKTKPKIHLQGSLMFFLVGYLEKYYSYLSSEYTGSDEMIFFCKKYNSLLIILIDFE